MFSKLLLPVQSLFRCFRSSLTCHMCSVVFLPVYSLFKCFRSFHACHMCSVLFLVMQNLLTCFRSSLTHVRTLSLSFLTNSSSDSKAFLSYIAFSGFPTAVHHIIFLFFEGMASHKLILFKCTTVGIPFSDA